MRSLHPVDFLVDIGYRGIACRLVDSHESTSGSQAETETFAAVARAKDGVPKRFMLLVSSDMWSPMRHDVTDQADIGEQEYSAEAARLGGILDNAAYHAERASKRQRLERIDTELRCAMPTCPDCGKPMEIRTNRRNGRFFFGRVNFARTGCRRTQAIEPATLRRIGALQEERSSL